MHNHTISDTHKINILDILPLRATREKVTNQMLRVDHAGEFGAVHIYNGQLSAFEQASNTQESYEKIKIMQSAEFVHLNKFNSILPTKRIRPSALTPVWHIGGFLMGAVTALTSEKSAMACTEAVETVIDKHYETQINYLSNAPKAPQTEALLKDLKQFQQDELEHKQEAIKSDSQNAPLYSVTKFLIETICHTVIKIAHKV